MAADVLGDDLPGPPTTPVAAAFINLLYCTSNGSSHSLDADGGVVGTALTRRTADGFRPPDKPLRTRIRNRQRDSIRRLIERPTKTNASQSLIPSRTGRWLVVDRRQRH